MKKLLLASLTLLALLSGYTMAEAAAGPDLNLPICSLWVWPFHGGPDALSPASSVIMSYGQNLSSGNLCRNNTTPFPKAYNSIPASQENQYTLPAKAYSDKANIKHPKHIHTFIYNSLEDDYIYEAYVKAFEIIIQNDGVQNTNINNLKCPYFPGQTGQIKTDFINCKDGAWDPNHYGGILLSKTATMSGGQVSTVRITWNFGSTTPAGMIPLPGDNRSADSRSNMSNPIWNFNTGDYDKRDLSLNVVFDNKQDLNKSIWTATTTSRALVLHSAFPKANLSNYDKYKNNSCSNGGWCFLDPSNDGHKNLYFGHSIENNRIIPISWNNEPFNGLRYNFYWYDIGTVVSVWKNVEADKTLNQCTDLNWTSFESRPANSKYGTEFSPKPEQTLDPGEEGLFEITPNFSADSAENRELVYIWEAETPQGKVNGWFHDNDGQFGVGGNPFVDTDYILTGLNEEQRQETFFKEGSAGTTVRVQAYYVDNLVIEGHGPVENTPSYNDTTIQRQKAEDCYLEFTIPDTPPPPPLKACTDLNWASFQAQTEGTDAYVERTSRTLNPDEGGKLTVEPSFAAGKGEERPLVYRWLATTNNGDVKEGEFTDNATSANGFNPLMDTDQSETNPKQQNLVFYSGGPAETTVEVQAYYNDGENIEGQGRIVNTANNNGKNVNRQIAADCALEFTIPDTPPPPICKEITVTYTDTSNGAAVTKDQISSGKIYEIAIADSSRTDGSPVPAYNINLSTYGGEIGDLVQAEDNIEECTDPKPYKYGVNVTEVPLDCKYLYTADDGDSLSVSANPSDDVEACMETLNLGGICEKLSLIFTDTETEESVALSDLEPGTTYEVAVDLQNTTRTDDTPFTGYNINLSIYGAPALGILEAHPDNEASCVELVPYKYGVNVPTTDMLCKYLYTPADQDTITFRADPWDEVEACLVQRIFEPSPPEKICQDLGITTSPPIENGQAINPDEISEIDFITAPIYDDESPNEPVFYSEAGNGNGYFVGDDSNDESCPQNEPLEWNEELEGIATPTFTAPSSCRYSYVLPTDGSSARITIKAEDDDNVDECLFEFTVQPDEEELFCEEDNFKIETISQSNQIYRLSVNPVDSAGNPIESTLWTISGAGSLELDPTLNLNSYPQCLEFTKIVGSEIVPSACRYLWYQDTSANASGTVSARAYYDTDTISPNPNDPDPCASVATYGNPDEVVEDRIICTDIDVNYNPIPFDPTTETRLDVTVEIMQFINGTPYFRNYTGDVGFKADDGKFSGGTNPVSGAQTDNFISSVNNHSKTGNVYFENGKDNTDLFIRLENAEYLDGISSLCQYHLRPQPPEEEEEDEKCTVPPQLKDEGKGRYCVDNWKRPGTAETLCWELDNRDVAENQRCYTVPSTNRNEFNLRVYDCSEENPLPDFCADEIEKDTPPEDTPPAEPTIEKKQKSANGDTYFPGTENISVNANNVDPISGKIEQDYSYQLTIQPGNFSTTKTVGDTNVKQTMSLTIEDPVLTETGLRSEMIPAKAGLPTRNEGTIKADGKLEIRLNNGRTVTASSNDCNGSELCAMLNTNGSIAIFGITPDDEITIEIPSKLESGITIQDCKNGDYCLERFVNQAKITKGQYCYEEDENQWECSDAKFNTPIESNEVFLELNCSYFVTRASGDVFLEDDLEYGVDISMCYPFKNISSTIVKPIPVEEQKIVSTGTADPELQIFTISNEVCRAGQEDFINFDLADAATRSTLLKLYGSQVSQNLSSQICEVGLVPGIDWNKESINQSIEASVNRLTRYLDNDFRTIDNSTFAQPDKTVYFYDGKDATNKTVEINGLELNSKARTIIVKNADLYINADITYGIHTNSGNPQDIASLGIIVINGNVYVDDDVTQIAGAIFVTKDDESDPTLGNIAAINPDLVNINPLTINGSVFGNIGPLFKTRSYTDGGGTEGAITIRYDQRIIQNTPPGLSELFGEFSQSQIAR